MGGVTRAWGSVAVGDHATSQAGRRAAGARQPEALDYSAAHALKCCGCGLIFHIFGNHAEPKIVGQFYDFANDFAADRIAEQVCDQTAVNFDPLDIELREV